MVFTAAISAAAASIAVDSSLANEASSRADAAGTSRFAGSRSRAMDSAMVQEFLVDDARGDLDNQDTMTASCHVSLHVFQIYFDCIYMICIIDKLSTNKFCRGIISSWANYGNQVCINCVYTNYYHMQQ